MKLAVVVPLFIGLFVGSSQGQGMFGNDWMRGLFESINQLNANIQGNVQQLNRRIQEGVRGHLEQIDRLNKDASQRIEKAGENSLTLGNTGTTIVVNNGQGGSSRTVFSGQGPNGEPYFRDSEDRVVGDVLHHTERVYNPARRSMDEYRYTLDLKNPNAKPVVVPVPTPVPV